MFLWVGFENTKGFRGLGVYHKRHIFGERKTPPLGGVLVFFRDARLSPISSICEAKNSSAPSKRVVFVIATIFVGLWLPRDFQTVLANSYP